MSKQRVSEEKICIAIQGRESFEMGSLPDRTQRSVFFEMKTGGDTHELRSKEAPHLLLLLYLFLFEAGGDIGRNRRSKVKNVIKE